MWFWFFVFVGIQISVGAGVGFASGVSSTLCGGGNAELGINKTNPYQCFLDPESKFEEVKKNFEASLNRARQSQRYNRYLGWCVDKRYDLNMCREQFIYKKSIQH